jgi:ribosomal protein L34E
MGISFQSENEFRKNEKVVYLKCDMFFPTIQHLRPATIEKAKQIAPTQAYGGCSNHDDESIEEAIKNKQMAACHR